MQDSISQGSDADRDSVRNSDCRTKSANQRSVRNMDSSGEAPPKLRPAIAAHNYGAALKACHRNSKT